MQLSQSTPPGCMEVKMQRTCTNNGSLRVSTVKFDQVFASKTNNKLHDYISSVNNVVASSYLRYSHKTNIIYILVKLSKHFELVQSPVLTNLTRTSLPTCSAAQWQYLQPTPCKLQHLHSFGILLVECK